MSGTTDSSRSKPNSGGRPSSLSPEKLRAICAYIRHSGLSDLAAAELAGVARSTLSRWKHESEEVALQLEAARAQYLMPRLQRIAETRLRDGRLDWRAQAWLIKFSDPETHGRPSSRRRLCAVEVPEEIARPAAEQAAFADLELGLAGWREYRPGGTITPPMERVRAIYRQAGEALPVGAGATESVAFPLETSVHKETEGSEGVKSVGNPPETLAAQEQASLTHPKTPPPCDVELHSSVRSQVQLGNEGRTLAGAAEAPPNL